MLGGNQGRQGDGASLEGEGQLLWPGPVVLSSLSFPTQGSGLGWFAGKEGGRGGLWSPLRLSPCLHTRFLVSTRSQCTRKTRTPAGTLRERHGAGHCGDTTHVWGSTAPARGGSSRPGSGCPPGQVGAWGQGAREGEEGRSGPATFPRAGKLKPQAQAPTPAWPVPPAPGWGDPHLQPTSFQALTHFVPTDVPSEGTETQRVKQGGVGAGTPHQAAGNQTLHLGFLA